MRCSDCGKFVGLETQVEEPDLEISFDSDDKRAMITGYVRVTRNCADCGNELKEYTFQVERGVELKDVDDGSDLTVEVSSCEPSETGGGRYKKNMIGFDLEFTIKDKEGRSVVDDSIHDEVSASSFEELV